MFGKHLFAPARADVLSILSPFGHTPEVSLERHKLIVSRVQGASGVLAVVTLAWIVVDALTMSWPLWGILALERFIAAAAFWMLASYGFKARRPGSAYFAVVFLILIPSVFLLVAHFTFLYFSYFGQSSFVSNGYLYSPFLIAVSISVFPLTALESALLSVPILAVATAMLMSLPDTFGPVSATATLLRLLLMGTISSIAGMSQLRLLMVLTEQSIRDNMTKALRRSVGEKRIHLHFKQAAQNRRRMTVMFIDLDRFKSINDEFGHEAGDAVLQQAAWSIGQALDRDDTLVRWGGEEFVVGLFRTNEADARAVIERIARAGIGTRPDGLPVTASIGIAERIDDGALSAAQLIALADKRMYAAKNAGRNCYDDGKGQPTPFILPPERRAADGPHREIFTTQIGLELRVGHAVA